jgi:hypothetical protein
MAPVGQSASDVHWSFGVWHENDFPGQPGESVESMQSQPPQPASEVHRALSH